MAKHKSTSGKTTLEHGQRVTMKKSDGGRFNAYVHGFENGGAVAVLVPILDAVKAVYPRGYKLGCAHWDECLEVDR